MPEPPGAAAGRLIGDLDPVGVHLAAPGYLLKEIVVLGEGSGVQLLCRGLVDEIAANGFEPIEPGRGAAHDTRHASRVAALLQSGGDVVDDADIGIINGNYCYGFVGHSFF